jgi:hypothetical protein
MLFCKYYIDVALRLQKSTLMQTWGVLYVAIIVKVYAAVIQNFRVVNPLQLQHGRRLDARSTNILQNKAAGVMQNSHTHII